MRSHASVALFAGAEGNLGSKPALRVRFERKAVVEHEQLFVISK